MTTTPSHRLPQVRTRMLAWSLFALLGGLLLCPNFALICVQPMA